MHGVKVEHGKLSECKHGKEKNVVGKWKMWVGIKNGLVSKTDTRVGCCP